ncbi:single-stranded DNA-binding protein [Rhodocyclaceae bacterium SMB388]
MNSWSFTGNIGSDAETHLTDGNTSCVNFSVAVRSGFGKNEATTWARCKLWGNRGEALEPYLVKGQLVGVVGELTAREWTDSKGSKRTSIDVRVNDITLLGRTKDTPVATADADFDDIGF